MILLCLACESDSEEIGPPETSIACTDSTVLAFSSDITTSEGRSNLQSVTGMGTLSAPSHTFPTPHTYISLQDREVETPILAPMTASMTAVVSRPQGDGYNMAVYFKVCDGRSFHFGHISAISDDVLSATGCTDNDCNWTGVAEISAGTRIGTKGGANDDGANLDFGTIDNSKSAADLPGGASVHGERLYAACPYTYFQDETVQSFYTNLYSSTDSCGSVDIDVADSMQGYWFDTAETLSDETYHLTIAPSLSNPERITIGAGSPKIGARNYNFAFESSGQRNRRPSSISADGNKYCFDTLYYHDELNDLLEGYILAELVSSTELKIEVFSAGDCESDVNSMSFTTDVAVFNRL